MQQLPTPPFSRQAALAKVQIAVDAWNSGDYLNITRAISAEYEWRSRQDWFQGRAAIEYFLRDVWALKTQYRLTKELWAFTNNRISVRLECEWLHSKSGQWYRRYGNEHWQFDWCGYMTYRDMSANNIAISAEQRRIEPPNK